MAKKGHAPVYVCDQCGAESPKWLGRCGECGAWNSLRQFAVQGPAQRQSWSADGAAAVREIGEIGAETAERFASGYAEVDHVLGGGLVPGSLTLLGGDPGVGKSTLLAQVAQSVAGAHAPVLYVSGEESPQQLKLRANRLGVRGPGVLVLSETDLDQILVHLEQCRPTLGIIDSIQTLSLHHVESAPGSVAQVKECTAKLMRWAKTSGTALLISGHVTKDGAIAGPHTLEHMVDVVLYLEGERFSSYRILRGVKNRFGSTHDVGIFEMTDRGLVEVHNPSEALLANRTESTVGSAIVPVLEGTRPLLVEVQALATPTAAPVPRRTCNGLDFNRMLMITAVLSKHLGYRLSGIDIIVNVTAGLRVSEPAADLAVATAIASSFKDQPVLGRCVMMGEIGLSGELRPVTQVDRRLSEAANMGFESCILPEVSLSRAKVLPQGPRLLPAGSLREALRMALQQRSRD